MLFAPAEGLALVYADVVQLGMRSQCSRKEADLVRVEQVNEQIAAYVNIPGHIGLVYADVVQLG